MLRLYTLIAVLLLIDGPGLTAPAQLQARPGLRAAAAPSAEEPAPDALVLQRLRRPVPRTMAVDALLGNEAIAHQLRAKLPSMGDLRALRTHTMTGTAVAHAATVDFKSQEAGEVPSYEDLEWASGIFVSPTAAPPLYRGETRNYAAAVVSLDGIYATPGYGLADIMREGISRHMGDGWIGLSVNLPQHSGIYLVSYRISCSDLRVFEPDNMRMEITRGHATRFEELAFTASADEGAVFALVDIPQGTAPIDPTPEPPMEQVTARINLSWNSLARSVYFGGVTITKL